MLSMFFDFHRYLYLYPYLNFNFYPYFNFNLYLYLNLNLPSFLLTVFSFTTIFSLSFFWPLLFVYFFLSLTLLRLIRIFLALSILFDAILNWILTLISRRRWFIKLFSNMPNFKSLLRIFSLFKICCYFSKSSFDLIDDYLLISWLFYNVGFS